MRISAGALELLELQKRRQLVNSKLETLNREQDLWRKMAAEQKKQTDIKASLEEFAALVSSSLKRISFENKQKLCGWSWTRSSSTTGGLICITTSRFRSPLQRQKQKCQPN